MANSADGTVSVIDTATDKVSATIPVSAECSALAGCPFGVGVSPDGSRLYVRIDAYSTTPPITHVAVINTEANTVITTIPSTLQSPTAWGSAQTAQRFISRTSKPTMCR